MVGDVTLTGYSIERTVMTTTKTSRLLLEPPEAGTLLLERQCPCCGRQVKLKVLSKTNAQRKKVRNYVINALLALCFVGYGIYALPQTHAIVLLVLGSFCAATFGFEAYNASRNPSSYGEVEADYDQNISKDNRAHSVELDYEWLASNR